MEPPSWVNEYIGVPFAEKGRTKQACDCWGLLRLVLSEKFGVLVESFTEDYASTKEAEEIRKLFQGDIAQGIWHEVDIPKIGDAVLMKMRMAGPPQHVGLVVGEGWMLHIEAGIDSCLERYDGMLWKRRILGFYRHQLML